jgi:uncharacterized membrane protein YhhN
MLAVALALTGGAALANWWTRVRPREWLETLSKPLTTILVIWVAIAADGPTTATVIAVVGLVLCLAGDIALLDVVDKFTVGLAAFLLAHLAFVVMFIVLGLDRPWWGIVAGVVLAVHVATVGRRIVAGASAQEPALRIPVIAYVGTIAVMAVVAAMTGRSWAIVGAAFFVASDSILGWRAFVRERTWMSLAVMVTYHAAITGIALTLL